MWNSLGKFVLTILSYLVGFLRLLFWVSLLFLEGLEKLLFTRQEICYIEVKGCPLRCDRDDMLNKLSYVDRLSIENPELIETPDDMFNGMDIPIDEDDNNNNDEGDQFP